MWIKRETVKGFYVKTIMASISTDPKGFYYKLLYKLL